MVAWQAPAPDSVRATLRAIFAGREYHWATRRTGWDVLSALLRRFGDWLTDMSAAHPIGYLAALAIMTLILVVILTHTAFTLWRALRPRAAENGPAAPTLPPTLDASWHLREARRLATAGRFSDALAHRFLSLVMSLDQRRVLAFHASKTPGEYTREARLDGEARKRFGALVTMLYEALFGGRACDAGTYAAFDQDAAALSRAPSA
ncbi:MAG TPA: DUF4129 domain-containing protein [Gemmatimonadales bacterium]|jgi:hypothetical protein